ncbi:Putative molybdenum cofactor biosynthesis protein A2 [Mycobacteroides abscessus]|uniref:GTP 3',8-cyclase MoaA n=1 Tax=Mycobacteroides abscessus TaxID=36809 RepID=UPI0005E2967B|nr:GTP 3',8-cyclase MoaA [Mycobacteroides abscessus]CPS35532.1 Putative molybdenum cofactor biosynthesis protein A2 [Mycobacteroides abscessus]CPU36294.1 Putative molybdenum cofactor biosynthesis protein A2 [Mycobacteroides abscessus]CPY72206.1 Putative molybdenum cofactor biosynthesis protein A2 [Mycobacteroides abscessus]
MTPLIDSFGRIATDLRVSLTDRCNLRCTYCMPAEGLEWLRSETLLTTDEYIRLIGIAVTRLGIDSVRFTGGEPLIFKDLEKLVAAVAGFLPRPDIAVTTNGIGLDRKAVALREAGLDRINVSLDTLDADRFAAITRRDRLSDVLLGLKAAGSAGLSPIKINAVLTPEQYKEDAIALLHFSLEHGYELRIIEQMPLDAGHSWSRARMVTADEIHAALSREFSLSEDPAPRGSAPAQRWLVNGGPATVGIIASVSRPFCGDCDRTRLTADGQVRNCLFATTETDLRGLLRSGASDAAVASAWQAAMWGKKPGHGINDPSFLQPDRPMSAIGG